MGMNSPIKAIQVNAFANQVASRSPTGVVLDADQIDSDRMLEIARSLNLSHTAFLCESRRADCVFAIRFFTPHGELKNCAHATIAAHCLRATKFGIVGDQPTKQETSTNIQEVWTDASDEGFVVSFKQNEIVQKDVAGEMVQRLLSALACTSTALHADYPVRLVSPGSFRFMVPLESVKDLLALRPDFEKIDDLCRENQSIGCFVFSVSELVSGCQTHGRMFAPTIGVDEDAVNGNSSGCLGAYLMTLPDGNRWGSQLRLQVLQGHSLGHPSSVNVRATRVGSRIETFVGGTARVVGPLDSVSSRP